MENNKNNKFDFNNQNKGFFSRIRGLSLFTAIFWAFFLALALSNVLSPYFSSIVNGLLSGITPLLLGIALAFVFYRLVDFIEKKLLRNAFKNSPYKFAIKRTISITIVLLIIVAVFALVISILVPKIIEVVQRLTERGGDGGTEIYDNVVNEICALIQNWFGAEVSQESIKNILNSIFSWFMETVGYINNFMALSMSVLGGLLNVIMGILLMVFILKDKEKISKFAHRYTYASFKKEKADELCVMTKNANEILFNYVICKLIEFVVLFISMGITFICLGMEFTWELALLMGLFNFIPYFGIYIGAVPIILITLIFNSINTALYAAIAIIVITTIEFNTIIPFITGKRLKVSALVVVSSIIIGGAMFGIVGMLFAPPIAALISVVISGNIELKENRIKYMMELDAVRKQNEVEQQEQLGIQSSVIETNVEKEENVAKQVEEVEVVENTTKEKTQNKKQKNKEDEDNKK